MWMTNQLKDNFPRGQFPGGYCQGIIIFFLSLHLTSLMIIGLSFSSEFVGFHMRCFLSISLSSISKSKYSFIVLIHISLVFSGISGISGSSTQFHLEYCSCFSTVSDRSSTFCVNLETLFVDSFMIFSLSLFFLVRIYQTSS